MLTGRIVTTDALHTQRYVAQTILDGDGDYVMLVKGNQPAMLADIQLLFQERRRGRRDAHRYGDRRCRAWPALKCAA